MVFPNTGAYIDCAKGFQYEAITTGVQSLDFNISFRVVSQNYGKGRSVAELENCA